MPGTADTKTGLVEYCPNLGWEDVPAGALFKKYLGADVWIAQDSRLAAWAEYLLGAGRNYYSFICVAIGTGIGGGIIIDGKIFHGAMKRPVRSGIACFRKRGVRVVRQSRLPGAICLRHRHDRAGIGSVPEKFVDRPHQTETLFELAYAGDEDLLKLIRRMVEDLAIGIANAVSILSPQAVIISGGLCIHEELIIKPLRELVNQYGYYAWAWKKHSRSKRLCWVPQRP